MPRDHRINQCGLYLTSLSACRFSGRILVFDDGHIIKEGHHDELVQQKGTVYDQLWQAQAQYYT